MIAQARFKSVQWVLLMVFALAPTAVLAQRDNASQGQTEAQVKTEETQKPTEAQAKTEEAQKSIEAQAKTEEAQRPTEAEPQKEKDPKVISGMSILGNQDAPKSLVIVPWKSSEIGDSIGISTTLDDSRLPIDKEVFMRTLSYYEISSETARPGGAPIKTNTAQPAAAAQGRKR